MSNLLFMQCNAVYMYPVHHFYTASNTMDFVPCTSTPTLSHATIIIHGTNRISLASSPYPRAWQVDPVSIIHVSLCCRLSVPVRLSFEFEFENWTQTYSISNHRRGVSSTSRISSFTSPLSLPSPLIVLFYPSPRPPTTSSALPTVLESLESSSSAY